MKAVYSLNTSDAANYKMRAMILSQVQRIAMEWACWVCSF
jgi:hypothetical protein